MPVFPCAHPTCTAHVPTRGASCPAHGASQAAPKSRHSYYDQHQRDREAKQFYNSAAWLRARKLKLAANPVCQRCQIVFAQHVHHKKKLRDCAPAEKLEQSNLMSLCQPCHNAEEQR
jgi:5-methylcytosine-specific restriction endonuclease McrA